jgi:hypothetical protein
MLLATDIRPVAHRERNTDSSHVNCCGIKKSQFSCSLRKSIPIEDVWIVGQIRRCLRNSSYRALRGIECDIIDDCFVLRGSVSSYYLKQLAQTLAGNIVGLKKVENHISVCARK